MTTIETVNLEDIYPLEDEYGNDMATRDYDLEVNQKYVEELADSFGPDGVPDELITLVRDSGIYRVKAGNSRVRAMKLLGTKKCQAIVEDGDVEEAMAKAIVETVIRTNTKKKYEALEESSFVRQLAMFGDDQYVSEVSGIEVEKVARVRKAAKLVDDAADDMSLLRLAAIGEFADDEEAVEELTNCKEKEWERVYDHLVYQRENQRKCDEIEAALEDAGIELVDERPEGHAYFGSIDCVEEIEGLPGDAKARHSYAYDYSIYVLDGNDVDPAEEARKEVAAQRRDRYEKAKEARAAFIAEHVNDDMSDLIELADKPSPYDWQVVDFANEHDIKLPEGLADVIKAYLKLEGVPYDWSTEYNGYAKPFIELTSCLIDHGYIPPEEELILCDEAKEALAALEDGDEDE